MVVWRRLIAAAIGMAALLAGVARASGVAGTAPWYLDQYGGDPPDMARFYAGRVGIVMPTAPRAQLFISWRLLHGLKVGKAAGEALSKPCCGGPFYDEEDSVQAWLAARAIVPGAPKVDTVPNERPTANFVSSGNCFADAFNTATATLKDRAAKYGAGSREVRAWLALQDVVFATCHGAEVKIPAALPGAPAWLSSDRDYQLAAQALYDDRFIEAAQRFTAISHEAGSPWRTYGTYLTARTFIRAALRDGSPVSFGRANAAVADLAAAPAGTFGRDEARGLHGVLAYRERPKAYLAELDRELTRLEPPAKIGEAFRDYADLGDKAAAKPDALDWMATLRADPPQGAPYPVDEAAAMRSLKAARAAALAHAQARWQASHDPAWLIAALSLTDPSDPQAAVMAAAARGVPAASPAWLSVQHHLMRLTLARAPAAQSRARLDAILARRDLSVSDRNVFTAQRAQVAASLDEFARLALRRRLCVDLNDGNLDVGSGKPSGCARSRWDNEVIQPSGVYDGRGDKGSTGFGEDARAAIDRAPLSVRMALAESRRLPAALRLDVALTSYGRAVALQDNAAIDRMAGDLVALLPLMAAEFRDVRAAKPGPGKRFAEFLVLAKIPGVRTDLAPPYVRPEGRRVADFQYYWADWLIATRPVATAGPPALAAYQGDGTGVSRGYDGQAGTPDSQTDLTCLGECGRGTAPLRLPDFIAQGANKAAAERRFFLTVEQTFGETPRPPTPVGAVSAWDEMLDYARAHRADPRVPEALHWLVHVGHFGGSHNHSGRRAFKLLHARYEGSVWAKKTPYYND